MLTPWLAAVVLTLLSAANEVLGFTFHLPKFGGCPDLNAQQKFITNIDKFIADQWYVQSSFDTEVLQGKGRCMTAAYKYNPYTHVVQVSTGQFNEDNNSWERLDANAYPADLSKDEAKFTVEFNIPIWGKVKGTYTILGTDYESYSVIHGCGSFLSILHYDCSWLMSKKQKMSPEEEEKFFNNSGNVLKNYEKLDLTKYKKVDQLNCDKS